VHAPRGWELVARVADGWLPSSFALPPEDATAALRSIRTMAEHLGRRQDSIEYAYNVTVFVGNPPLARAQVPAPTFSGSPDQIADQLDSLAGSGFTVLNLWPTPRTADQPRLLAEQVLPRLRS
jgi:alkanesulfonate monooxygenase SsuD/methylene tetrahydromethanopterin reductase-like flavin-dependent oxidoreductase (luciferase family)